MDVLLASMVDLPKWAVYAIVGGLLGAIGAAIGWVLEKKAGLRFARFLPILAIAATPVASREIVLPAIINAYANQELPLAVDDVTTLVLIEFKNRRYVYHYELAESVAEDTDVGEIKRAGIQGMCDYWRNAFAEGDVMAAEYRYLLHGGTRSFSVQPADC